MLAITLAKNWQLLFVTLERPNTTFSEFANTVDPDEKAHNHSRPIWNYSVCVHVFEF